MTERVVKFNILCPTAMVGLLKGHNLSNVMRIRAQTCARVSINPATGYNKVTLSAVETLDVNQSPASAAVFAVLPFCQMYLKDTWNVNVILLLEHGQSIGEHLLLEWGNSTRSLISVLTKPNGDIWVTISGGIYPVKNAVAILIGHLRSSYFQ